MLQFITQPETKYSIAEQCQMVIEGGGQWIQLHLPDADDAHIRELAAELIPLCRETATILMLENRPFLAKELGLHGVHITLDSGLNAKKIREDFGPEAIVGVEVKEPSSIIALKDADIDYVTLSASLDDARRKEIVDVAAAAGNIIPVVFEGNYTPDNVAQTLTLGAAGVCTGKHITEAKDPVSYTEQMLKVLKGTQSAHR